MFQALRAVLTGALCHDPPLLTAHGSTAHSGTGTRQRAASENGATTAVNIASDAPGYSVRQAAGTNDGGYMEPYSHPMA